MSSMGMVLRGETTNSDLLSRQYPLIATSFHGVKRKV
jgi:hypothetical protein